MAHHDLADAVDIGIVDADFDVVGHRHAGGVGIDLAERMQRVGAEQFGLAVQRAQRHAHGLEEFEGIRAERRAAGRRRTQPREAEAVAQRAEQQHVGEHRMLALRPAPQDPVFMPSSYRRCLSGEESITPARTSAAIDSQTRGANSTKVGAISRKSFIMVSGCSTKLIFIRHSRPLPSA